MLISQQTHGLQQVTLGQQNLFLKDCIMYKKSNTTDLNNIMFLVREQYFQQTGLDVDTSSFRAPGSHTAYANTVRSFSGRLTSKASGGIEKESIFDFDFTKEPYDGDNRETVQSAILKAYWKPHLSIKRSTGTCLMQDLHKILFPKY